MYTCLFLDYTHDDARDYYSCHLAGNSNACESCYPPASECSLDLYDAPQKVAIHFTKVSQEPWHPNQGTELAYCFCVSGIPCAVEVALTV